MTVAPEAGCSAAGSLRVASYNVHDLLDDRSAAARVVRAIDPDVLCLQEVPRRLTTEVRLPAFARDCGLWWSGGRAGTGGTAVLTSLRMRVHAHHRERLPVRFPDRSRGFAMVEVSLPGDARISVVSVHLGLRADERARHTGRIMARLDSLRSSATVIAGDLNEGADGSARRMIAARYRKVSDDRPTFPASAPNSVLDAIFAGPRLAIRPGAPVALVEEDVVVASDHRPVWVDLCPSCTDTAAMNA